MAYTPNATKPTSAPAASGNSANRPANTQGTANAQQKPADKDAACATNKDGSACATDKSGVKKA